MARAKATASRVSAARRPSVSERAGAELVAGERDHLGRRADERDALLAGERAQPRVLGQEAVAGVDRVAAGSQRGLHDRLGPQVALARARGTDADRAVGELRGGAV